MARRAPTIDPVLAQLRREVEARLGARGATEPASLPDRRRSGRRKIAQPVFFESGDLSLVGTAEEISSGGLFLASEVVLEVGERGLLRFDPDNAPVPVRVVWSRGTLQRRGFAVAFEPPDAATEMRLLQQVLELLDRTGG